jgi:xylan 1,4-beta-xylosidase
VGPQGMAQAGLMSDYENDESCFGGGHDCIQTIFSAIQEMNGQNSDSGDDDAVTSALTQFAMGVDVDSTDSSGIAAALALVQESDIAILVLGITKDQEKETEDRTDTDLPGLQNDFAHQVLSLGKPTIMILTNGGQLAIDTFVEHTYDNLDDATAADIVFPDVIVEAFNPNGAGASAIAEALFATPLKSNIESGVVNADVSYVNRWGKLPYTMYPHDYIEQQDMTNYDFSLYPGRTYKYYQEEPLYPFGFGLSLTSFQLDCYQISETKYQVNCSLTNTGSDYPGDEVIMVFHNVSEAIRYEAEHPIPLKQLVDFQRVGSLQPQESQQVIFNFDESIFRVVDENGEDRLYEGVHTMIFTNGVNESVSLNYYIYS